MITVLALLALARSRRGQRYVRALTEVIAPPIVMIREALLPIFVELADLARVTAAGLRRRARRDRAR